MKQDYRPSSEPIPAQRRALILEKVRALGSASIGDLAEYLRVSASTVRRDLDELMLEGALERTHGGAVSTPRPASTFEPSNTHATAVAEKQAIGEEAARRIAPGSSVILDAGSTVDAAARAIVARGIQLTIITNSLSVAQICSAASKLRIIVVGGTLRNGSPTLWGEPGESFLTALQADLCLLGAHAVTEDLVTESSIEGAGIKRLLMRAARRTLLLVDSSKFQPRSFCEVCRVGGLDEIICDKGLQPGIREKLRRDGVKLTLVTAGGSNRHATLPHSG